jgi:hypothetical protein
MRNINTFGYKLTLFSILDSIRYCVDGLQTRLYIFVIRMVELEIPGQIRFQFCSREYTEDKKILCIINCQALLEQQWHPKVESNRLV